MSEEQAVEIDALIRWMEHDVTQARGPNGDLRGYHLTIEQWRQMRATLRRFQSPTQDARPGDPAWVKRSRCPECQCVNYFHEDGCSLAISPGRAGPSTP